MIYLITQTILFLAIAWLIGIVTGYFLVNQQKSEKQQQLEAEALDARHRAIAVEKQIEAYKAQLAELEGLPEGARASRVAAREEMAAHIVQLERDLAMAQNSEKRLTEESGRLRSEVEAFRARYLEARAKWDEYKAKADALASDAQPLDLGVAQIVPDEGMRQRISELEAALGEAQRERDRVLEQGRSLAMRLRDMERQAPSSAPQPAEALRTLQARVTEMEGALARLSSERDGAVQQAEGLAAKLKVLESQQAGAAASAGTAEAAQSLRTKIAELETTLARLTAERDGSAHLAQGLAMRVSDLEQQVAAAGQGNAREVEAARLSQARISELESRLASGLNLARERDALRSRVGDLQDKLAEAEAALSKAIPAVRGDSEPLQKRIAELEQKLEAAANAVAAGSALAIMSPPAAPDGALREQLADAERRAEAAERLAAETGALRARISELEARPVQVADTGAQAQLSARIGELEQQAEVLKRQAGEAQSLRSQVASLEKRLAEAAAEAQRSNQGGTEDVALLKARLADVEARLLRTAQSSAESAALRNRVVTLESLLHEAAKSRDEAAVLRSKVAELDGRLGMAMKAIAEARSRRPESEPA